MNPNSVACDRAVLSALQNSLAIIEFQMDGTILTANQKFLDVFGFSLSEVQGWHHSMFLPQGERQTQEYRTFWDQLRSGEYQAAEYRRIGKDAREVWIQASYNPVLGPNGEPDRIVKIATDITSAKLQSIDCEGKIAAIGKSQAVIEFAPNGVILDANENFCRALGYGIDEIRGRHHSIFVTPADAESPAYAAFWAALRRGAYQQAEFRRIGKDGRDVWIQATYNPILDPFGRVLKIVKFATDVTEAKRRAVDDQGKIAAIDKSQAVIEFAMDGTILTANDNFLQAMGYAIEEIRGRHHRLFVAPEEQDGAEYQAFWAALRRGEFRTAEYRRIGKGGGDVWIQASYNPIIGLAGEPIKVVKIATDITEEVARREQVHLLSLVANETSNAVVITDADGLIEYVNAAFVRMSGYTFEEVRGRNPGDVLQGPATCAATRRAVGEKLRQRQPFCDEILNYTKAGEPYWVSLSINPVAGTNGACDRFISIQSNVTERRQADEQLAFIAHHDPLTGLANRSLFQGKLMEALQQGRQIALLCLDLDRFKLVNDTLGHPAGDELLRQVADRLRQCARATDTVARLGGDEFAVICDGFGSKQAVQSMASRIIDQIAAPFEIAGQPVSVGVSVGIAYSASQTASDHLVEQADQALYCAKSAGRGRFQSFEPALDDRSADADEKRVPRLTPRRPLNPDVSSRDGFCRFSRGRGHG